jgi:hypothetical protein
MCLVTSEDGSTRTWEKRGMLEHKEWALLRCFGPVLRLLNYSRMNSSSPLPELTPSPPPTYAELQLSDIPSHSPRPRRSAARQSALKTLLHLDAGPMHPPEKLAGQAPNNHSLKRPLRTESPPFADSIGQQWAIQAPSPSPPSAPTPTFASTLQTIVCMRLSDPSITRCTHCITRQTGDSCRFRSLQHSFQSAHV